MTGRDPTTTASGTAGSRLNHRSAHRLSHAREYQAAYAAKLRAPAGPLVVFARPNQQAEPRLGLSVSRRVGPAVVRNRVKRLLREAFRHERLGLPSVGGDGGGRGERYDYVVTVRPHALLPMARYRALLREAAAHAHRTHLRRIERDGGEALDRTGQP